MHVVASSHSEVGPVRDTNEDAVLVDDTALVYAIADGMGGHAAGEVAAQLAIDAVRRSLCSHGGREGVSPRRMRAAFAEACAAVHEAGLRNREHRGMGCTLTVLAIVGHHAVLGHVGDSRAYRVREGRVDRLTLDHTLAAELDRAGLHDEASNAAYKHLLTRSIGTQPSVLVDTLVLPLRAGDRYVLLSDGAIPTIRTDVTELLRQPEPARALVGRAIGEGSQDNATAIVVEIPATFSGETVRVEELLGGLEPLADLSTLGVLMVREAGRRQWFEPEEVLVRAGRELDRMFLVAQGALHWQGATLGSRSVEVGEAVGLTTLLGPRRAPADLVATRASEVFVLTADGLRGLARRRNALAVNILLKLGAQLTRALESDDDPIIRW